MPVSPRSLRSPLLAVALGAAFAAGALGDTLVLRSGRTYRGDLISVRDGRIEFRVDRGRVERFDTEEVDRIEFSSRDRDRREELPSGGAERPSGLREREVQVAGQNPWTAAGIEVRDGQELWFDARGEVRWGPGRKDGPSGESGSPRNQARPIPNRPAAALIGKVGESGDPFFIGADRGPIRVRGRGALFLGINDDYLQDNNGGFRVVVSH